MRVLTASYPAEYGRKLGGVVEVTTNKNPLDGLHGELGVEGGSFSTADASGRVSYASGKDRFSLGGQGFHTDRYLDSPVLQNFTNRANSDGFAASYERDFSENDRLRMSISHNTVRFLAPNELVQQTVLQRQDIADVETSGQIYWQHIVSPDVVMSTAASVPQLMIVASCHHRFGKAVIPLAVSTVRSRMSSQLIPNEVVMHRMDAIQMRRVSGCSKSNSFNPRYLASEIP